MSQGLRRIAHDDDSVIEDVREFFLSQDHRIFQRGDNADCNPDTPFYKTQLQVLFENDHFHWVTDRAISALIKEGFLKSRSVPYGSNRAIFVWRHNIRYISRQLSKLTELLSRESLPEVNRMVGDHAEALFKLGFRALGFKILSENTSSYREKAWAKTDHNLDLIVERDSIGYGVEIKNTFDYIPVDELQIKAEMCNFLGLIPFFICRHRARPHRQVLTKLGGELYIFGSKLFPLGQESFTKEIWNQTRLPVKVASEPPKTFEDIITKLHQRRVDNMS